MTVIYYMKGVVVVDQQDPLTPWSTESRRLLDGELPPGFLPKSKEPSEETCIQDTRKIDTRALKRARRGHRSPKNVPQEP